MNEGWIKLHRKMEDHWLYPTGREFTEYEAWQDILLQVNHKKKKVRIKNRLFTCHRGQSLRSVKRWGMRWKWSKTKVYRFFELLEQDKMIETVSETVTTRLTVCKYDSYQDKGNADETQKERPRNDHGTTPDTNKNAKNVKNDKKYDVPSKNQIAKYFSDGGEMLKEDIPLEAEKFWNHYEDAEWKNSKGKRIKNWKLQAGTWTANYKKWNADRLKQNGAEVYQEPEYFSND